MGKGQDSLKIQGGTGLTKRHQIMILALLGIIVIAVIGHFIVRPDRNASLKIIYTGDLQGQIQHEAGSYAGYDKIAALADELSRDGSQVILLDAGNCLGGNEMAETDDGRSMIALMNAVGYDAMTPGTMDFIYGAGTLSSLRAEAAFPFLAANIRKSDGSNAFENYKILNINNVRIGIVGVTTGLSQVQAARDSLTVQDPVEAVQEVMKQMAGKTDAIIVLAYTGDAQTVKALSGLKGVSMIIESGHVEAFSDKADDGTMIVSPGRKGSVIGVASIDISKDKTEVDNSFYKASMYDGLTSDDEVTERLETVLQNRASAEAMQAGYVEITDPETDEPEEVPEEPETAAAVDAEPETSAASADESEGAASHNQETALGSLTADAMLHGAAADGAVMALIRDKSIQGELTTGNVSRGQIGVLFDDNLYLVTCKMTGGEIRSAIEDSFNNYPNAADFLQVSGISYTYDADTDIGSHLSNIVVAGHSLDDAKTYIVAMTNRMADELGYTSEATGRVSSYRTIASLVCNYLSGQPEEQSASDNTSDDGGDDENTDDTENTKRITIIE